MGVLPNSAGHAACFVLVDTHLQHSLRSIYFYSLRESDPMEIRKRPWEEETKEICSPTIEEAVRPIQYSYVYKACII